jgi:hypothetical protein
MVDDFMIMFYAAGKPNGPLMPNYYSKCNDNGEF